MLNNTPDLFDGAPLGRLAYWQAMAGVYQKTAVKQLQEGKAEAGLDNLRRMAYALEQAIQLEKEGQHVTE